VVLSISFSSTIARFGPSGMYIMRGDREGTSEKEAMGKKQHTGKERDGGS